jgi:eukaryotic-like serine/threonine-protein kinase
MGHPTEEAKAHFPVIASHDPADSTSTEPGRAAGRAEIPNSPAIQRLLDLPAAERRLGPFLLVKQLGRGGFAPVWLAREVYGTTELRTAAVKLFPLGAPESPSVLVRRQILEEARSLCQVEHPSVVRFYTLALDEARGVMGLAMEYVAGAPLDQRLAAEGRLHVPEVLTIGSAIASALAAVHRAGLVHRDVKPANVIEAAGVYKLIDFGIAAADALSPPRSEHAGLAGRIIPGGPSDRPTELVESKGSALGATLPLGASPRDGTRSLRLVCGTIGYIDPVCIASGAAAAPASDLYALGALLFKCLTGRLPAQTPSGDLSGEVLDGRAPAPPLQALAPDVPASLARLVDALLAPDRAARPPSAERIATELAQIKAELAGLTRELPPEDLGPFRGLGRFKEEDRDVYFGRSSEVATTLEAMRVRGLVALVGPSGSGKSSLARAGVLPRVAEGALFGSPEVWDTAIVEPGHDPRAAIAAALSPFVPDAAERAPEALAHALADRARAAERGIVLLVDQLEELATLSAGPSRDWTLLLLRQLAEPALPGVRVLVTARRDLLDPLLALEGLGKALMRGSVLIEPMMALAWGTALDQALGAYGYAIEDEALRQEILDEIRRMNSAMPLVEFALTELWDLRDREAKRLTRAGLRAIGGLAGALDRHAEITLAELCEEVPDAEATVRAVLLQLTTPQETRALRSFSELEQAAGPRAGEVIEAFEQARLVIAGAEGVTLAHEALLVQWGRLRHWLEVARDDRLLAEELEEDAARWQKNPALVPLWSRLRLALAEDLVRRAAAPLSTEALVFVEAGRRASRRQRLVRAGGAAAVLLASAVGITAYVQALSAKEEATRQALIEQTRARELAEQKTQQLRTAQAQIDKLVEELRATPSLAKLRELEQRMTEAKREVREKRAMMVEKAKEEPAGTAAAGSGAAAASAAPKGLEVETEWGAGER